MITILFLCQSVPRHEVRRAAKGRIAMNKLLLALGALMAGALLIPDVAEAQRGGRGGGGGFRGGGGWSAAVAAAASGAVAASAAPGCTFLGAVLGSEWGTEASAVGQLPHDRACQAARSVSAPEVFGRLRSPILVAALTVAMTTASAIVVTGDTAMARLAGAILTTVDAIPIMAGATTDGTRTTNGWGWGAAGLATGAAIGAAATYPYYGYPYSTYQTPISGRQRPADTA